MAVMKYMGYNNIVATISAFGVCNPTPGASENCLPWWQAGDDYGFSSAALTTLYFGSAISQTIVNTPPAFFPTPTVGAGSITSPFLFLEASVGEASQPTTQSFGGVNAIPESLPSLPVTVNLSGAACAGTNCSVTVTMPSCPMPNPRYLGYYLYAATGSTSTPPVNTSTSWQWQPMAAATFAQGQAAQGDIIPCGTSVTLSNLLNTATQPPTTDAGNTGAQRPGWMPSTMTDQTGLQTLATDLETDPGVSWNYLGDEPGPKSVPSAFNQIQTMNQYTSMFTSIPHPGLDSSARDWRTIEDMFGFDPYSTGTVISYFSENAWATPTTYNNHPTFTPFNFNSLQTPTNNSFGSVAEATAALDVTADQAGQYLYGTRPCQAFIGDFAFSQLVGFGYAELRREELKHLTGCQNWGITGFAVSRYIFGNSGMETSVWVGNTNQVTQQKLWRDRLNSLAPVLLQKIDGSSRLGLGTKLTAISSSTTVATDCGAQSGYIDTTNYGLFNTPAQIRFVTHIDQATGNILILANNLCYGSPTVTFTGNFGAATTVAAEGDPVPATDAQNFYSRPISGGQFSDTFGPMEQKIYSIPFAAAPIISFNPTPPINLGSQGVGSASSPMTVTITNTGNANLTFGAQSFSAFTGLNAGDFTIAGGNDLCATQTVLPGANCTVAITFTPSVVGSEGATLNMNGNVTASAALTGIGQAGALSTSPTTLTFPATVVGQHSPTQTFTLTNAGPGIVTISNIQTFGDFSQSNACGTTLGISGPAASCVFTVTFTPTQTSGLNGRTGSIVITSNASNSPTTENLQGTGISVAQLNLIIKNGMVIKNGVVIK